jgi:cell division protease FtsH
VLVWLGLALLLAFFYQVFSASSLPPDVPSEAVARTMTYSDLLAAAGRREVSRAVIDGGEVRGQLADGSWFVVQVPRGGGLADRLVESGARVSVAPEAQGSFFVSLLLSLLPVLVLVGFYLFMMRQFGPGGRGIASIGRSRAKLMTQEQVRVTFADVAGVDEAKAELQEIVDFLRDPRKFQRLGGRIPKGVLLVGPPGTGKTLLARAVAGEANVPFFTTSGSDFVEMFVGVGAARVRDMFEQARKNAPCIVFIDEIDAVGRHRGAGLGGGNDEREQTLNQILVAMDGFEAQEGIIIVAATNRPDVLDPALLRPGRFDRQVVVGNPDVEGRLQILTVHARKVPLAPDVDLRALARGTPGFSGADLANLVNEAALFAARHDRRWVTNADFEAAKDKVMMGPERRSLALSEEEKWLTAVHEAGHALVGALVPGNDPVHKVTIVPRGRAMGVTISLPEKDRFGLKKSEVEARLAMYYGGRVAEQEVFGADQVSTGAQQDLKQIADLARRMVTEWGMSDVLGALRYAAPEEEVFLGRAITRTQNVSEETARLIDAEVKRIAGEAEERARALVRAHRDALERLARALMEHETLEAAEVLQAIRGEPIVRRPTQAPAARPSSVPVSGAVRPAPAAGT